MTTQIVNNINQFFQAPLANIERTRQRFVQIYHKASDGFSAKVVAVAKEVWRLFVANLDKICFVAFTISSAFYSPGLFLAGLVVTVIVRSEVERRLRKHHQENWLPERNPYNREGPAYKPHKLIDAVDLVFSGLGGSAAFSLGTVFKRAVSPVPYVLPLLGGIAAGNVLSKYLINNNYI